MKIHKVITPHLPSSTNPIAFFLPAWNTYHPLTCYIICIFIILIVCYLFPITKMCHRTGILCYRLLKTTLPSNVGAETRGPQVWGQECRLELEYPAWEALGDGPRMQSGKGGGGQCSGPASCSLLGPHLWLHVLLWLRFLLLNSCQSEVLYHH